MRTSPLPTASAITDAEFARCIEALNPGKAVAVAFSGGPDSLALLMLASRWTKRSRKGARLLALIVDHGLRAESTAEADRAGQLAKKLGVPHRILRWSSEKPRTGMQAAARDARYALLAAACRAEEIDDLLVAHHLEDQAETFLLRLARGSGVDGLAAMSALRHLGDGVRLLRPLLAESRARLAACVRESGLTAIQDPSNENERFERVKARRLIAEMGTLGLDAQALADTATRLARVRTALEQETQLLLCTHAKLLPEGYAVAGVEAIAAVPEEIGLRALANLIKCVSGGIYAPRFEALEAVYVALRTRTLGRGRTLNGCKLALSDRVGEQLIVTRELAASLEAASLALKPGQVGVWDRRFEITLRNVPHGVVGAEIRALKAEGAQALKAAGIKFGPVPKAVVLTLPGLWKSEHLLATPHFGALVRGYETDVRLVHAGFSAVAR